MKKQLLLLLICFFAVTTYAQRTVTGVVTSAEDGLPIIGASILVKGTTQGTITDLDGNYSVTVSDDDATLIISYVGMDEIQMRVGSQSIINVVMKSSSLQMDEVVVTAMGIKAEKKKLNFAVQTMNSEDLTVGKPVNFVDALQGRIAGVEVSGQGGSPSGSSQVLIRGISSVNTGQNNEPIFILDGVQVSGGASQAANLNPSDIESITVLKGAAAAALYGQDAANGAIMVTTKSAAAGVLKVEANVTLQIDNAVRVPKIQQMYGPGGQGIVANSNKTMSNWGPLLDDGERIYDNIGAFLQTGFYHKYDFSISGGTEKFNVLASGSYSQHEGVVPDDYLDRWGVMLKANMKVNKRLSFTALANLVNTKSRGSDKGIMKDVYRWPINDDMSYYQEPNGDIHWRYMDDTRYRSPINPLWSRNRDDDKKDVSRNIVQATMNLNILKGLDFIGRIGYDYANAETIQITERRLETEYNEDGSYKYPAEINENTYGPFYGKYLYKDRFDSMLNGSAILTYDYDINSDFKLNVLAGFDFKDTKGRELETYGLEFVIPGIYSLTNMLTRDDSFTTFSRSQRRSYGYYGELKLDYKGLAHIGGTFRNDHSSTLSKKDRSYWYPSVSGGLVFSELFQIANDNFTFGKIRGNWAKVGKDPMAYRLNSVFKPRPELPDGGYSIDPTVGVNYNLLPEMMSSWELGVDLRFFENRTRLDVAYYRTTIDNQIVDMRVSPASGYIIVTSNNGSVRNEGMEITLDQSIIKNRDFTWDASLNIAYNRGKLLSLAGDLPYAAASSDAYVGTDIKAVAYIGAGTMAIMGVDYQRTEDGKIICNENGVPEISDSYGVIGNREPKATAGFMNRFTWKNWDLSFLLNFRLGGDVINATSRSLLTNGQHKMLETYRNRRIVIDGVVPQEDGTYLPNTTPITFNSDFVTESLGSVSTPFIEDGSFIRLSHLTLGYDFSQYVKKSGIKGLKCSLTGRNLFLLTKYSGSDPQINYTGSTGGSGTIGIDNMNIPNTRSFTLNINATF